MSKIARVKFIRDKEPNIKALTAENRVLEGALYVATDTGTLWMGISSSSLIQIKDNINTNTTYNLTKSGNTITLRGSDGSTFNVTDSNTVYGNATASAAGLMSAADKTKLDGIAAGSNHVTVDSTLSADSTNPVQNKVIKSALDGKSNTGHTHDDRYYTESEINTKLNAKANSNHTHTKTQITDFPTSMPASDVYAWAKAANKPSYTLGEVSGSLDVSRLSGVIDAAHLPSYVDDVIEGYLNGGKFYTTKSSSGAYSGEIKAEAGKIYVDLNNNKTYRWSGSAYVVISETIALGTTHSTAGYGDESHAAYAHSLKTSGNPHHVTKADVGLGSVDNTADSAKSVKYATSAGSASSASSVPWSGVSNKPSTFTPSSHTHTKSQITDFPSSMKNPNSLTISLNGTSQGAYDGSVAKSINVTPSNIGAAPASHSHSYLPLSGGTISGRILRGAGGSWISARNNTIAFGTTANSGSYNPVVGQKTVKGSWTIGNLAGNENLVFSYDTDTNFNAGTNSSNITYLPIGGNSQTIITSATIGSQSVSHANTAGSVAWSNVSGRPTIPSVGNGTITITQNGTNKGSFTLNQSGNATIALTDNNTVYSLPAATSSTLGGVKVGSNITNSSGTISLTKANVTAALGYTPPTTNTWRPEEVIVSSTQPSASTCKLWIKV